MQRSVLREIDRESAGSEIVFFLAMVRKKREKVCVKERALDEEETKKSDGSIGGGAPLLVTTPTSGSKEK